MTEGRSAVLLSPAQQRDAAEKVLGDADAR